MDTQSKNKLPKRIGMVTMATIFAIGFGAIANAATITQTTMTSSTPIGNPEFYEYTKTTIDLTSGTDTSFAIFWHLDAGIMNTDGATTDVALDASSTWTMLNAGTALADGYVDFSISIDHNTMLDFGIDPTMNAAILSFAFGVDPNAIASFNFEAPDASDPTNDGEATDMDVFGSIENQTGQQNFPGGFKEMDVCIFSAGCNGGNINTGLQAGDHDYNIMLRLDFLSAGFTNGSYFEMLFFPMKFQSSFGSYELPGDTADPISTPTPQTVFLMLGGLSLIGFAFRRSR